MAAIRTLRTLGWAAGMAAGMAASVARPAAATEITGPAGRLHVDDGGTGGPPVVFLHSFAGSGAHWAAQLAHLRPKRRAIAVDLRGHGRSDVPASGHYTVASMAGDVAAVAQALKLPRFVLVGHSLGGAAAIAYAGAHPDRVAGLVLVATPGKASPDQSKQVLAALAADYDKTMEGYWTKLLTGAQPGVEAQIRKEKHSLSREASLSIIQATFEYDPVPALKAYFGAKLLVDTAHSNSPGALQNLAPEIARKVLTGTSHWPHLDKPDEFNRILAEFLLLVR